MFSIAILKKTPLLKTWICLLVHLRPACLSIFLIHSNTRNNENIEDLSRPMHYLFYPLFVSVCSLSIYKGRCAIGDVCFPSGRRLYFEPADTNLIQSCEKTWAMNRRPQELKCLILLTYYFHPQVKKNYEALRQREEEERMVQSSPPKGGEDPQAVSKWEKESHEATRELLKVKDRLIEVERNVSLDTVRNELCCEFWFYTFLSNILSCVVFPECYSAGWEGGPEEPTQTTGNPKLQPAGSDSGCAEADGLLTGEQYNATDAEC